MDARTSNFKAVRINHIRFHSRNIRKVYRQLSHWPRRICIKEKINEWWTTMHLPDNTLETLVDAIKKEYCIREARLNELGLKAFHPGKSRIAEFVH